MQVRHSGWRLTVYGKVKVLWETTIVEYKPGPLLQRQLSHRHGNLQSSIIKWYQIEKHLIPRH